MFRACWPPTREKEMADIRDEWRIQDVERKADRAVSRLYELDSLRSDVGGLERANGALRSEVDGLRNEVAGLLERVAQAERLIYELNPGVAP